MRKATTSDTSRDSLRQRFNTEHSETLVGREDAAGLLQTLAWHFDEPFGDTSALPTYVVSRIARQLVTVVLTGDGGDEVLGGYPGPSEREIRVDMAASVPSRSLAAGFSSADGAGHGAGYVPAARRAQRVLESAEQDFVSRLLGKQIGFTAAERTPAPRRQPACAAGARIHRRSVGTRARP